MYEHVCIHAHQNACMHTRVDKHTDKTHYSIFSSEISCNIQTQGKTVAQKKEMR